MEPIVKIHDLFYAYRGSEDKQVLKGIDLEIQKGEFLAIAGRTGSGKSTLCYTLNALVPHSFGGKMEGTVQVCGITTSDSTPAELARKVGIVLQSAESQLVGLTVEEDVQFGLENIALPVAEIKERSLWALDIVKMTPFLNASPWSLSGGQKQRLAIASALAFQPEILIFDNPTAELDPIGKEEVLETIGRLNRDLNITIVIVDQELHEIIPFADRIAIMDEGRILIVDTPEKVLDQGALLREAGVKLPDVTEIGYQLRKSNLWRGNLPITIPQAKEQLAALTPSALPHRMDGNSAVLEAAGNHQGETLIDVQDVRFNYAGGQPVLKGVNLTIRRGEFVALMGQNGAGKTTLAKHFNGLLKPANGRVIVEGMETRSHSVAQLATKVGYVFQNPDHQIFSKTVYEELAFGPKNLGWEEGRIKEAVAAAAKDISMEDRLQAEPYFLGLAERKLLAIASVLIMQPDVLVLDEPATGADFGVALRIMRYISSLHQRGLTVVIITHDVSLAANYASRMLVMREGQIVLDGTPDAVFRQKSELRECKVSLPQVAELSEALQECGLNLFAIRVDDMVKAYIQ